MAKSVWKKVRTSLVLTALCSLVGVASAQNPNRPEALPGTGWNTGIQIQNVGTSNAEISLTGYARTTGTAATAANASAVAPGASANFVNYPSSASSFDGAGVVSSDQPIVAIVNVTNSPSGFAAGQYQGTGGEQVATTVRFPLAKNNLGGKCTTFYVQNASSSPNNIIANFSNGSSATFNNVPANSSVLIDPAAATPALPSSAPFALTVTGSQPLAGTVLEHFCAAGDTLQATRGFTPNDSDTILFSPIYKVNLGNRNNGLQVQNVDAGSADITVVFSCVSGCSGTYTHKANGVASGNSATFFNNGILGATTSSKTGDIPAGSLLSAKITSTVAGGGAATKIVAINNESFATLPAGTLRQTQTTFSVLPASAASAKVGIPLAKEFFGNKTTGIQVQNTGDAAITAKVVYKMTGGPAACQGTFTLSNISIAANNSVTLFKTSSGGAAIPAGATWDGGTALKTGCFGGATVEVTTAGGKAVAVVQEPDVNPDASLRQDTKNYEGFPIN